MRPVDDKFVIDDDMDSDTVTESNLSLKSRSFLNRVNDRLRKILDHSSKDAIQDIEKRSMICGMFLYSTLAASVLMGKKYSENSHSIKSTNEDLTLKQMFDTSEKLIVEQSDGIFGVSQISWEDSPWRQLSLVNDEEVISLSHAKMFCIFRFCVMSWKGESEPSIKYCLGRTVGLVQRFTTIQNFGHH